MLMLILALFISTFYFALSPYPLVLTSGFWTIKTNLAIALLVFFVCLTFLAAIIQQVFGLRTWFQKLEKRRLQGQLHKLEAKKDFLMQTHTFLISLSKDFSLEQVMKAKENLQQNSYRHGGSFREDTRAWAQMIKNGEFSQAFGIIKNAEPYLPYQYSQLWFVKTLQAKLHTVIDENTLRVVQSKIPKAYLYEPVLRTPLLLKICLYRQKKEAWKYLKNIYPDDLSLQESQILFEWMRADSNFWYEKLAHQWSGSWQASSYGALLLCKLALVSGKTLEARTYLDKMPNSSERFYLEHTLSAQADKRLNILTEQEFKS